MKSIKISHIQHNKYLEFLVTGTFDLQDALDNFIKVLDICRLIKVSKVLIDFRKLRGLPFATEKSLYAFRAVEIYKKYLDFGGQPLKFAYVGIPPIVSSYKPGLKIARSSEVDVDLFTDINKAYDWLDVRRTAKQSD